MTQPTLLVDPPAPPVSVPGRDRRGRVTIGVSALIAVALLLPLVFLLVDTSRTGWHRTWQTITEPTSLVLLRHTVGLGVLVTLLTAVIGVSAAWLTERSRLPGRRVWAVLLVLPVAMPDFVVGYAWHSIDPRMNPLGAATLVMTLASYPLVYLPVAAALRRADPAMEEASYSLGIGRVQTFVRVTLPLIRTALLGGSLIVVLAVISEYGAFEVVRYQTYTTAIFTEFEFDPPAAAALCIPLVLLGLVVLLIEATAPRRLSTIASTARSSAPPTRWGGSAVAATGCLLGLIGLGVGVPIGTLLYWMAQSQHTTLPAAASLATATEATVGYSALGALAAVALALPVALMTLRRRSAVRVAIDRSTYVTQALPGVVIALSLVFFAVHYWLGIYQTSVLLVAAYAILHFPLALVCVRASVAQARPVLIDIGHSLGRGPIAVFFTVTLPLIAPGLAAGFCLVFLTAVTELTATLVLAPIGVETLATQFWAFQSEVAYGAAAPYALMIVAIAVVPGALLGIWFDRDRRPRERRLS